MNGWTNHVTWEVWVTISNVEPEYLYWQNQLRFCETADDMTGRLKRYYGTDNDINFEELSSALMGDL